MPSIAQVEPMTTARALRGPFDYRLPEELCGGAVEIGSMLVVPFGRREVLGVVVGLADSSEIAAEKLLAPLRALELGVPAEMVELAGWIAGEYCSTLSRALGLVLPPGATRRLSGRRRRPVSLSPRIALGARALRPPILNADQEAVLASLYAALAERRAHARLLHGVTGSGKTEVYLRAAEAALAQDRGVIVLVPEIALTPQTVSRFVDRFGETVAVLHSQLRAAERYAEWRRLREGAARICVGPRSAVFAPIERLGLIVIDEEHESSYKHEGDPRYDARDVAAERARRADAVLLLGSATPRAESAHRVVASTLPRRVDGRPLPPVGVLDMRGAAHGLHPQTEQALARVREERGKAIVLLNRRGWSNFLSCRSCGHVWSCPHCDVALVLHRAGGFVACHHCGHREPAPERCGECASVSVARHGAGTERLQHELASVLDDGDFPIFRLDADVAAGLTGEAATSAGGRGPQGANDGDGAVGALLRRFEAADCGVLIGTQMVAKGHDFPDVTLGVVLDADATLRFPDFRAEERTFALIAQLAGRVGRGADGRVLAQTIAPQARAILHAARHDSDGFLAGELERRRALDYPPFSHLIRIVCSAEDARPAREAAGAIRELLRADGPAAGGERSVLGPAALFRLRGRERESLIVKARERRPAVAAVGEAVKRVAGGGGYPGVHFGVDVDPQ
ncbi:MAG TPA: primosomal protein N' [Solirubrobacteraceae bacterium]|jgi:primosomal protein N' (replication factor Y)|nr:primosomal protein N' [Solirubrobacteraceae bacterium]